MASGYRDHKLHGMGIVSSEIIDGNFKALEGLREAFESYRNEVLPTVEFMKVVPGIFDPQKSWFCCSRTSISWISV